MEVPDKKGKTLGESVEDKKSLKPEEHYASEVAWKKATEILRTFSKKVEGRSRALSRHLIEMKNAVESCEPDLTEGEVALGIIELISKK